MRYLAMIIVLVLALGLVFILAVNLESLSQVLSLRVGIPTMPLGTLSMPVWVALLALFAAGFITALILDIIPAIQQNRIIAMQRKQILNLQDALTKGKSSAGN